MARKLRCVALNQAKQDGIRHFHLISRTVRQQWLISEADMREDAREVLKRLTKAYTIGMCSFSIMSNHFHTVVEWNPQEALDWSPQEIIRRWEIAHPIRCSADDESKAEQYRQNIRTQWLNDPEWIEAHRKILSSLSFFMKDFKQFVGQAINQRTDGKGAVWEGRFKMHPLRDQSDLVTTMAYVDLNPHAAGMCEAPEQDTCTSLHERTKQAKIAASTTQENQQAKSWLKPLGTENGTGKPLLANHSEALPWYLKLVDATARMLREGKKQMDAQTAEILQRLGLALKTELSVDGFTARLAQCSAWE
jgi:REP element-mobilizing transposase RayT